MLEPGGVAREGSRVVLASYQAREVMRLNRDLPLEEPAHDTLCGRPCAHKRPVHEPSLQLAVVSWTTPERLVCRIRGIQKLAGDTAKLAWSTVRGDSVVP